MYADMQVMIHNEGGIGIPIFISSIDGHASKLKGLSPIPLGGMIGPTGRKRLAGVMTSSRGQTRRSNGLPALAARPGAHA